MRRFCYAGGFGLVDLKAHGLIVAAQGEAHREPIAHGRCLYILIPETPMTKRMGTFSAAILLFLSFAGCVRREGRNADCKWPGENPVQPAGPRHLSADAEFAEDLAIRYADTHFGLRTPGYVSGEVYVAARDRCMASLFEQVAAEHHVPSAMIWQALGRNRGRVDLAINLPFLLLYGLVSILVARWIWRKYPPAEHGWIPCVTMTVFFSLAMAAGMLMLGEVWSWIAEGRRVGNPHMSHRVDRLWWVRHRIELFVGGVTAFWLALLATALRAKRCLDAA